MATLDFVKQYFDAWNAHDADAIVKLFVDGGTYSDPSCSTLTGKAIGEIVSQAILIPAFCPSNWAYK